MRKYVHGYTVREAKRLDDQSSTMEELLHYDSIWKPGERVLEAGCGIGSQTRFIAKNNPQTTFLSIDISETSVAKARERIESCCPGEEQEKQTMPVENLLQLEEDELFIRL